ncbi:hypothetical protein C8R43DRAFT_1009271 [Mycena crocata]|nr:hypothetical protein C8R43DRAFT_1009271 [Mycena crocata]
MTDDLQSNLREKAIQNHRLESQIGELEIRISHYLEDLSTARADRDRFEAEAKDASGRAAALGEELNEVKVKYKALKLSIVPQVVDHKRKREADDPEIRILAPAFREENLSSINGGSPNQNQNKNWSSANTVGQFLSSGHESTPTTPQRPVILSHLSSTTDSSSTSTDTSPRSPGLQVELRSVGVHSTPWSQHANSFSLQSSPMSTRSNTPSASDSQRTTDPRKRAKPDANQTPTPTASSIDENATPTAANTTIHATQISSIITNSPAPPLPTRPRGSPTKTPTRSSLSRGSHGHESGPRMSSEIRKRTISLSARPLRSSPRHHSGIRKDYQHDSHNDKDRDVQRSYEKEPPYEEEAGEVREYRDRRHGYSSTESESS